MASENVRQNRTTPIDCQMEPTARPSVVPGWSRRLRLASTPVATPAAIIVTGQAAELCPYADQAKAT